MNQLSLLPIDEIEPGEPRTNLVALPRRAAPRRAPRTAVGAPGYLSVAAAAERLGLRPRSVRYLIEHDRLRSQRLGRMHFLSTGDVEAYRRARRARRRAQARLA
jgi:hypothetical protein